MRKMDSKERYVLAYRLHSHLSTLNKLVFDFRNGDTTLTAVKNSLKKILTSIEEMENEREVCNGEVV